MNKSTKITFSMSRMQKTSDVLLDDDLNMLRMEKEAREARKRPNNEENKEKREKTKRGLNRISHFTRTTYWYGCYKFVSESDQEELWAGKIISYDHNTNMHTLVMKKNTNSI